MKFVPHDYQKYAIEFIKTHPVSAVLLDMGLGKTSITLSAINDLLFDSFEISKVLVIAPLRVARSTWTAEVGKWDHLQNLICSVAVGTVSERKYALKQKADIYIINRENVEWLIDRSGFPFDYDMVVIDELSSFKSGQAKRFKTLMKVRHLVKRVVGLTGTPASNGLMDLWAEYRLLDMGARLGKFITQYRNNYFRPDKMNGQIVYSYKPLPGAEQEIYDAVSDITISMKADEHLKMPDLISTEYTVSMSETEKKAYSDFRHDLVLNMGEENEITAANAAVLCNKLSQMANGAIYDDSRRVTAIHDRKLDALEDIIESANGKPLLIAYWFQHDLERIKERLCKLKLTYGELKSSENIQQWCDGKLSIGLIHPASAGHGLNLQSGGSTIVWFGLTWSLELYQQTNARLWRQGQNSDTVVLIHIVTEGTVDRQMLEALKNKDKTQAALINAVKANL